eukprot:1321053-Alexandrium_andersonii.AAC.1
MPRSVPSLRGRASRADESGERTRTQAHMPMVSRLESQFSPNSDSANFPLRILASEGVSSRIEEHSSSIAIPSDAQLEDCPAGPMTSRRVQGD